MHRTTLSISLLGTQPVLSCLQTDFISRLILFKIRFQRGLTRDATSSRVEHAEIVGMVKKSLQSEKPFARPQNAMYLRSGQN